MLLSDPRPSSMILNLKSGLTRLSTSLHNRLVVRTMWKCTFVGVSRSEETKSEIGF